MNYEYVNLIKFIRNGLEEKRHTGFIVHLNRSRILQIIGNCEKIRFYQRSCSKPLQFSTLINKNIDTILKFSPQETAVCCASHSGTKEHQNHIRSILNKINLTEKDLLCPPDNPLDKNEQEYLIKNNLSPKKIHNNCSGKHSAMLALCKFKRYDIKNYNDPLHPISELVIQNICELCEVERNNIIVSKDGCTLPTVATTLPELGKGFLNLFLSEKYRSIKYAMLEFPYLAGGHNRIDSEIMNAGSKNIIAKVGAGGIIVVVNLSKEEALCVKISDADYFARTLVTVKSMLDLGWITNEQIIKTPLKNLYNTNITTETGEIVGSIEFMFGFKN